MEAVCGPPDQLGVAAHPAEGALGEWMKQDVPGAEDAFGDTLHLVAGPHISRLGADARAALFSSAFVVSPDSNRMGYRLEGPGLETSGEELLSFGLVAGALQLPSNGQPILLMADHQTAGGYPVVATVVSASMAVAAQLAPGDEVRFAETSIETALQMRAVQREALESLTS